jgi:hypothetical protein
MLSKSNPLLKLYIVEKAITNLVAQRIANYIMRLYKRGTPRAGDYSGALRVFGLRRQAG